MIAGFVGTWALIVHGLHWLKDGNRIPSDEEQHADARRAYERVFEEAALAGAVDRRASKKSGETLTIICAPQPGAAEGAGLAGRPTSGIHLDPARG
jgi:hypothetical protein